MGLNGKSVLGALKEIYQKEGRRGIYKGLSMNWVKGPLAIGVSFSCNDVAKERIWAWRNAHKGD